MKEKAYARLYFIFVAGVIIIAALAGAKTIKDSEILLALGILFILILIGCFFVFVYLKKQQIR
jgi:hypothetical protein